MMLTTELKRRIKQYIQ